MGLGPGRLDCLTGQARQALEEAQAVVGYRTYLELAAPLLEGKQVVASAMTRELDRAGLALDLALRGQKVALVSSGDPGIYAMAAVVFELARSRGLDLGPGGLALEVVPGVPALAAAASLLGAPLSHDFACVSLSDRLTPWELIEKRLSLAAEADFVIVLYNPKSKGRAWQLGRACEIIAGKRSPQTPVGVVRKALRQGQSLEITDLAGAPRADIDMQTLLIVGNSQSFTYQGRLVTPRGYIDKYGEK
ncbi:hypothetical protein AAU61_03475 [Desulfocarbo indianensis]|nr:hypothetical protein AAU61_03475 [Desulfocarbo indianensis]